MLPKMPPPRPAEPEAEGFYWIRSNDGDPMQWRIVEKEQLHHPQHRHWQSLGSDECHHWDDFEVLEVVGPIKPPS
jgi:hypothetical protein